MPPSKNAFETGAQKVIPAVLAYLRWGGKILMLHRKPLDSTRKDFHEGKWNGLGGKLEPGESPLEAAQREVQEESGLLVPYAQFQSLGVVQFPHFKPTKNEDWIVFVFEAILDTPTQPENLSQSAEGELHWVSQNAVSGLALWPGDQHFIPYVLESRPFVGTIWYRDAQVERFWFQAI